MLGHGGSSAGRRPYFPHPLALCCHYPVSKCHSASIVVTSTVRVKGETLWRMLTLCDANYAMKERFDVKMTQHILKIFS